MKGLFLDLEVPYFATFRKPTSSSLILSYSVPPFTTIRGMFANALGLNRDDLSLQDNFKIGIRILDTGDKNYEMARILKLKKAEGKIVKDYPSSPMSREYLVLPKYRVFVSGEENLLCLLKEALLQPRRSLYLGQSDELVDIQVSELINVVDVITDKFDSLVSQVVPGALLENLPFKFEKPKNWRIVYQRLSIPSEYPTTLNESITGYRFGDQTVQLF